MRAPPPQAESLDAASRAESVEKDGSSEDGSSVAELRSVLGFVQSTAEDEKARLARTLHDELGGVLTSARIDVEWLRKSLAGANADDDARLERLAAAIDEAVMIERRVVESLRPSLLDHLGLGAALDWYVTTTCKTASIACRHRSFDESVPIPRDLAIVVYRVVQDAFSHIIDHGGVDEVRIALKRSERGLHLSVSDNSRFDPEARDTILQQRRVELMRQRALALGGSFELERPPSGGMQLSAFFPHAVQA